LSSSNPDTISLDVDWWLENPGDVISTLKKHIGSGVAIDASESTAVPAQVAQLLLSAKASAMASDVPFTLVSPSEAAARSLASLGVFDHLMDS